MKEREKEPVQDEAESEELTATGLDLRSKWEMEKKVPTAEILADLADLYKIFGDSTRLSILSLLRLRELCVGDLAELTGMTPSAISHQLRGLRGNNLVRSRRDGKMVYYSLADEHVETIIDMGLDHILE